MVGKGLRVNWPVKQQIRLKWPYLNGGDGPLLGGGDPFLHGAHVGGESRLVAHSGRDTTQEGGHLGWTETVILSKLVGSYLPPIATLLPSLVPSLLTTHHNQCFPQSTKQRGGKTCTSKGLMHSSDHIIENYAMNQ